MMQSQADVEAAVSKGSGAPVVESRSRRAILTACVAGAMGLAALCGAATVRTVGASAASSPAFSHESAGLPPNRDLKSAALLPQSSGGRKLGAGIESGVYNPPFISTDKRRSQIGSGYKWQLVYQEWETLSYWFQVKPFINAGLTVQQTIVFSSLGLKGVMSGAADSQLSQFGNDVAQGGVTVYVRIFHELNGDWYSWGSYDNHNGNSKDDFKKAYAKAAGILDKTSNGLIKFQLAYNCDNPKLDRSHQLSEWYPGQFVDMVCCSAYNMNGDTGHYAQSFSDVFSWGYGQMTQLPWGGPLCVAETSSTDKGGPNNQSKGEWFKQAANDVINKFGRVRLVNWFLWNESPTRTYDVNGDEQERGLSTAIDTLS